MGKLFVAVLFLTILGCSKSSPKILHTYLVSSNSSDGDSDWYYYDQLNRIVRIEHKNPSVGLSTEVSYNGVSWLVKEYTIRNYNHLQSSRHVYNYDGSGNITRLLKYDSISAAGYNLAGTWEYNWSPLNLNQRMLYPSGIYGYSYRYTWNNAGNLSVYQQIDSLGRVRYREEDSLYDDKRGIYYSFPLAYNQSLTAKNNPTMARVYPGGTGVSTLVNFQYTYNADGYVTRSIFPGVSRNYVYERR